MTIKVGINGFGRKAALCDIFAPDAFGTAHRAKASTFGIAKFAKLACASPLLAAVIEAMKARGAVRARCPD